MELLVSQIKHEKQIETMPCTKYDDDDEEEEKATNLWKVKHKANDSYILPYIYQTL